MTAEDSTLSRISQPLIEPLKPIMSIPQKNDETVINWIKENPVHQIAYMEINIEGEISYIKEKLMLNKELTVIAVITGDSSEGGHLLLHIIGQRNPENSHTLRYWKVKKVK